MQQLRPEYAAAAEALREEPTVALAKVDATAEEDLAQSFMVEAYPDIKFFINGSAVEYNGGRDECAPAPASRSCMCLPGSVRAA